MIVAASENDVIGRDGDMPWRLSSDLRHFKNLTMGLPVIMGRKTFESIGKPLPGRTNIVITSDAHWAHDNVLRAPDVKSAVRMAEDTGCREAFVIGGGKIYEQMLDSVDRIYLTRVHARIEGDTFFPPLSADVWEMEVCEEHPADEKNNYDYAFQRWIRKH